MYPFLATSTHRKILKCKLCRVVDLSKKDPNLNREVQGLLLEVVDLKQEVPDLRSDGIPCPQFDPWLLPVSQLNHLHIICNFPVHTLDTPLGRSTPWWLCAVPACWTAAGSQLPRHALRPRPCSQCRQRMPENQQLSMFISPAHYQEPVLVPTWSSTQNVPILLLLMHAYDTTSSISLATLVFTAQVCQRNSQQINPTQASRLGQDQSW